MKNLLKIFILFFSAQIFGQTVDIIPQLKMIEQGKIDEAKQNLEFYQRTNKNDPNVLFLQAVLTENGEDAQKLYQLIYSTFPNSKFADAALFRNFSYFYAIGLYRKAEKLKRQLEEDYPNSPYLKNTDRTFPQNDEMLLVDKSPINLKSPNDPKFTIQAGAFGNLQNAQDLKNKFVSAGLKSEISDKTVNNIEFHVVNVGEFMKRIDAEELLKRLKSEFSIDGRIKPIE
jgi:tetratricopeptide (TPR) repeat protein